MLLATKNLGLASEDQMEINLYNKKNRNLIEDLKQF